MIIVIKPTSTADQVEKLAGSLRERGFEIHFSQGREHLIMGLVGDTKGIEISTIRSQPIVEKVIRVEEPYKIANKVFHPGNSVYDIDGVQVGGDTLTVIAGPCSVESEEQIVSIAKDVKASGAKMLRGGAFKPRTSPYSFQGMGTNGLELLLYAKKLTGLPIVTEIMDLSQLPMFDDVDVVQVGARNCQNFTLLKELGRTKKPVLLKRGMAQSIKELLMSAEYIMAGGNERVILCERGIRTFETATRNTLDLSAVPVLKEKTHLPVVVDPTHATGVKYCVEPMSMAAIAAGADGLMIEVHNNPECALCDGEQAITPQQFDAIMKKAAKYAEISGKTI